MMLSVITDPGPFIVHIIVGKDNEVLLSSLYMYMYVYEAKT